MKLMDSVKVLVLKVVAAKTSLLTSGSNKALKLVISIPSLNDAAKIKTLYVGPVLIYEIGNSVATTNTYIANKEYDYFTSSS